MAYPRYIDNGGLSSTNGANISCAYPSVVAAGDFLVLIVGKDVTSDTNSTIPTGFTFVHTTLGGAGIFCMAVYYRIADGTETGTFSHIWDEASANITSSIIYRYSNIAASPIEWAFGSASDTGPEATANIDGGTTTGNQRLLLNAMMAYGQITIGDASGWTESDVLTGSIGGYYISTKAQEQEVPIPTFIADQPSSLSPSAHYVSDTFSLIPGVGWPHHFLGVDNANIGNISGVDKADIEAVNEVV